MRQTLRGETSEGQRPVRTSSLIQIAWQLEFEVILTPVAALKGLVFWVGLVFVFPAAFPSPRLHDRPCDPLKEWYWLWVGGDRNARYSG